MAKKKTPAKGEQKDLPGMTPSKQKAMERKVLQIVEAQRESKAHAEEAKGHAEQLGDMMEADGLLAFRFQGYVGKLSKSRKVTVTPEKATKPRRSRR